MTHNLLHTRQYRQAIRCEATRKRRLFLTALTGHNVFPLHVILFPVRVNHGATANLLIIAPFPDIFLAVGKDPRAFAMPFVLLPCADILLTIVDGVGPLPIPFLILPFPNISINFWVSKRDLAYFFVIFLCSYIF